MYKNTGAIPHGNTFFIIFEDITSPNILDYELQIVFILSAHCDMH